VLKAVLHHNLLDYAYTLTIGGKYGWLVRSYGLATLPRISRGSSTRFWITPRGTSLSSSAC